jgi:hypothetical protein
MQVTWTKRVRRGLVLILSAAALAMGGQVAYAQTTTTTPPYPGPVPTTTTPADQNTTVDLGFRGLGAKFTVSECGFREGTEVTFTVNGVTVPPRIADASGCVQETFEIQGALAQALGVQRVGRMLAVTGLAASSGNVVVVVNGQAVTIGPLGSKVTSIASGTATNGAHRTVTVTFTVLRASQVNGSGGLLARTGTTILKWAPLGAGLVAVGYMLMLVSRRRRAQAA